MEYVLLTKGANDAVHAEWFPTFDSLSIAVRCLGAGDIEGAHAFKLNSPVPIRFEKAYIEECDE